MKSHFQALAMMSAVLVGCSGSSETPTRTVVRDSAGVEIVENSGGAAEIWQIVEPHRLEIGVTEGDAAYQFSGIRSARRLSDGTLVIADNGSREVRFYDSDGNHLRSVGGQGSGPGEYETFGLVEKLRGDSLLAVDSRLGRATVLEPGGTYVRDWSLSIIEDFGSRPMVVAIIPDGRAIVRRSVSGDEVSDGYRRDRFEHGLGMTSPGSATPIGGEFGGSEYLLNRVTNQGTMVGMTLAMLPFSRSTLVVGGADKIYVGMNDTYEIHAYDLNGNVTRIIRRSDIPAEPVDDGVMEWYIGDRIRQATERGGDVDTERIRTAIEELPRVSTLPAYSELLLDSGGHLWVRDHARPWIMDREDGWHVFDPNGFLKAFVRQPEDLRIQEIGDDYLLGVVLDEFGVERVRLYDVIRAD